VAAVACAVQNMYLTAEAYGAGCYWGTGGVTYYEEAKEFFGLGENDLLMGFFYVGVPKMHPKSGRRKPAEDKVRWEK
jgi:nitroreductase